MSDCIIITGPTATGKTAAGIRFGLELNGDIISIDSRQSYSMMDIGTGKDLTKGSKFHLEDILTYEDQEYRIGYYLEQGIRIWLYDIATPLQPISSALLRQAALKVIDVLKSDSRLPIIIGGAGYYLTSLVNPPMTMSISPNNDLREKLKHFSIEDLQTELERSDPGRLFAMNSSDKHNPRRLIRAVEVALAKDVGKPKLLEFPCNPFWIGLNAPLKHLEERIVQRVDNRLQADFISEVIKLKQTYPGFESTVSAKTFGYSEFLDHLSGKIDYQTAALSWLLRETQYVKRQLTWFKKQEEIHWFDITDENWYAQAKATLKKAGISCR